jgi:MoaA/NifB/PqqE/SkfB family radical SAM enzyme
VALFDSVTIDVEASNRCNADCDFCPRDMTPHQGTMSMDVFDRALARVAEFRDDAASLLSVKVTMAFCGLGEGILNPQLPEFVRRTAGAGFEPNVVSNGSLLTEQRARALSTRGSANSG